MRALLPPLLVVPLLAACSGDGGPLDELPRRIAAHLQRGELDEAFTHVTEGFEVNGLDEATARKVLWLHQRDAHLHPVVAEVVLDPAEDGEEVRNLTVLGLLLRRPPGQAGPRDMRPFRVEASARLVEGRWRIESAHVER